MSVTARLAGLLLAAVAALPPAVAAEAETPEAQQETPHHLLFHHYGLPDAKRPVNEPGKKPGKEPGEEPLWERETLTGDWGGARTALKDKHGIDLTLAYIGEGFGVLSGGVKRRASYQGLFELSVDTDLEKLLGWKGGSTQVTLFNLHQSSRNAADNVGSIADPSNIDALPTTRLFTAWFQQNLFDDRLSLRIGQLAADKEFLVSPTAEEGLINGTFGWPGMLAENILGGGPAFPLATPGARLAIKATDKLTFQTAVFSGNPAGDCTDEPQVCNRHGTTFSFSGGALSMTEWQYAINQEKNAPGLPGVYKLGFWYATANFADQHLGRNAAGGIVSLADPTAVDPLHHSGNWGFFGVADQTVWRGGEQSLSLFVRGGIAPSDRNLVSYQVDAGAGLKAPLPGRDEDVLTFGFSHLKISDDAAALDRDALRINGPPQPIRSSETLFELGYRAEIAPWWTLQPDLQYIIRPGGNVPHPDNPNTTVKNAFLIALRSTIKF
jgi:porin